MGGGRRRRKGFKGKEGNVVETGGQTAYIYIISSILRHVSPVINFQQWMWCKCNA